MNRRKKKKQETDYVAFVSKWVGNIQWRNFPAAGKACWMSLPKRHRLWLKILIPVVLVIAFIPLPKLNSTQQPSQEQRISIDVNTVGLSEQLSSENSAPKSKQWHQYIVQKGDTLAAVFRNNDLSMADLGALVKIEGSDKPLSHIKRGQLVRYKLNKQGELDILQLEKNDKSVMFFRMSNGSFGRSK